MALPPQLQAAAAGVIPAIEAGRLARGKGGEVMRSAICRLAETSAASGLPLSPAQQACVAAQLRDNLRHPAPEIQAAAAAALAAYAARYLPAAAPEAQAALVQQCLDALAEAGAVAARRGGALALGALPRWLLQPRRGAVLAALAAASVPEEDAEARDAETRVNAVRALAQVALTLLEAPPTSGSGGGSPDTASSGSGTPGGGGALPPLPAEALREAAAAVVAPLLAALDDYSTDNRRVLGALAVCTSSRLGWPPDDW